MTRGDGLSSPPHQLLTARARRSLQGLRRLLSSAAGAAEPRPRAPPPPPVTGPGVRPNAASRSARGQGPAGPAPTRGNPACAREGRARQRPPQAGPRSAPARGIASSLHGPLRRLLTAAAAASPLTSSGIPPVAAGEGAGASRRHRAGAAGSGAGGGGGGFERRQFCSSLRDWLLRRDVTERAPSPHSSPAGVAAPRVGRAAGARARRWPRGTLGAVVLFRPSAAGAAGGLNGRGWAVPGPRSQRAFAGVSLGELPQARRSDMSTFGCEASST